MKLGELIEISWFDANQRNFPLDLINNFKEARPDQVFIKKTTYGKLLAVNDNAILIQHEEDDYEVDVKDCTCIPRSWIISPKRLRA